MRSTRLALACGALLVGPAVAAAGGFDEDFLAARALALSGERDAAIGAYTALLERSPRNADVLVGRGRVRAWLGRWAESETDLRAATDVAPTYADAWSALGDLYLWSDRPAEAADAYGQWLALAAADDPAPLVARGRAWRAAGRRDEARTDFEAALARGADAASIAPALQSLQTPLAASRSLEPEARPTTGRNRWSASLGVDYTDFPSGAIHWTDSVASIRRSFDKGSLGLEALTAQRFGLHDTAWALDGYVDTWTRAYANLRFQQGPDQQLFPRTRWRAEVFQGVGEGWELSAGYDRLNYDPAISMVSVGVGRYHRDWYVRLRHLHISGSASGSSDSERLVVRYYYAGDADNYVEVAGGVGRSDQSPVFVSGPVSAGHSWSASAAIVKFVTPHVGFKLGVDAGYGSEGEPYSSRGFFGTLYTRW
jgi:YaiO family outer membrane protein